MSIVVESARAGRRASSASVREVCLLGVRRPAEGWSAGDRLAFSGRVYRVESAEVRGSSGPGGDPEALGYVHLRLKPDGASPV